ncbi:replication initiation protein [Acinetobacter sp.]|uniref:replication initiation protein n=1 Tax=Acinetobacter sp. TaxID=472 RepID=UPI00388F5241
MAKNLIVKSNQVVEAGYELTTNEQRLILLGISKIPKEQDVNFNVGYEITAQEFAAAYNIHPKTAYRELKEATNKLYERSIIIKTEKQTMKVRWTSSIITDNSYFPDVSSDENWKRVILFFSPQIAPYLSNLKENFTQYLQSDISNVSGAYTIRFYELICQYRTVGKREITINDLRFMLNIVDKYPLFYDLKKRVIEPSIKEINNKTPMQISYEQRKKGKTVVSIVFKFKEKNKQTETPTAMPKNSVFTALNQKTVEIPTEVVKQPQNANLSDLDKRVRAITGSIAKNNLASRFQYGNESPLEMMKRIQSEITSHEIADLWQNKLESMGIIF